MEKKLTIAIYSGAIESPVFIENLINALAHQDIKIFLFGSRGKNTTNNSHPGIVCFPSPNNRLLRIIFFFLQSIKLIVFSPKAYIKLISHYQKISKLHSGNFINWFVKVLPVINNLPDIFHIQWAKSLYDWFFLKELFGVKIVLSLRGAHINYSPLADEELAENFRDLFPKVDRFHAVSEAIGVEAKKYGAMEKKIEVIYSAVDIKRLEYYKKSNWITNNKFRFISVGRYHWKKGYQYALKAVQQLLEENIPIEYAIVAKDNPSEEILYIIKDLAIGNHVTFLHGANQKTVYRYMNSSDCLLLPSVEEGIANVVMEAMCIGLPVISSDCGGMEELIGGKNIGLLFNSRDVESLVDKMKKMLNYSYRERQDIAGNANRLIKGKHNIQRLGKDMVKLYHSIYNL